MNERMNEWMNEWMNERRNEWMNEWTNERTNERTNEWTNEWMNERTNERTNEWMNEWMNEWKISFTTSPTIQCWYRDTRVRNNSVNTTQGAVILSDIRRVRPEAATHSVNSLWGTRGKRTVCASWDVIWTFCAGKHLWSTILEVGNFSLFSQLGTKMFCFLLSMRQ